MKLATWNVNGIRARQSQVHEWIERDRPDVVCLQEIKATSDQVPIALCEMQGYWCHWHGGKGYSGVALHVSKAFVPDRPIFSSPAFDYESRVPHRRHRRPDDRVGVRAERRKGFPRQDDVSGCDGCIRAGGARNRASTGAARRHERRADGTRCAPEGAEAARDRPTAGGAGGDRAPARAGASSTSAARSIPTTTGCSPGGRPGATCGSATSGGASTTCSRARRWQRERRRVRC